MYTGDNPIYRTDPDGMQWYNDAAAVAAGAADFDAHSALPTGVALALFGAAAIEAQALATSYADFMYPHGNGNTDIGNALKHCVATCILGVRTNPASALLTANMREKLDLERAGADSEREASIRMDMANNEVGFECALEIDGSSILPTLDASGECIKCCEKHRSHLTTLTGYRDEAPNPNGRRTTPGGGGGGNGPGRPPGGGRPCPSGEPA